MHIQWNIHYSLLKSTVWMKSLLHEKGVRAKEWETCSSLSIKAFGRASVRCTIHRFTFFASRMNFHEFHLNGWNKWTTRNRSCSMFMCMARNFIWLCSSKVAAVAYLQWRKHDSLHNTRINTIINYSFTTIQLGFLLKYAVSSLLLSI